MELKRAGCREMHERTANFRVTRSHFYQHGPREGCRANVGVQKYARLRRSCHTALLAIWAPFSNVTFQLVLQPCDNKVAPESVKLRVIFSAIAAR